MANDHVDAVALSSAGSGRGARAKRLIGRRLAGYGLLAPGALWLIVFFVVPMYFMLRLALSSGSAEAGYTFSWHWANFGEAFSLYQSQFVRSFLYAAIATGAAVLISYPLAYGIVFRGGRARTLLLALVLAPFLTTYLIRTLAWVTILSNSSPVTHALKGLGIVSGSVLGTPGAVIAGITYNYLPFVVLPIFASLMSIDQRLLEAAADLHASRRSAFWHVTLPLSRAGVTAGALLIFIPAVGDYINVLFLGGSTDQMIGNVVQGLYLTARLYPLSAALSFALMVVILAIVMIYIRLAGADALMGHEFAEAE